MKKIALKRLRKSDLTFFVWHHQHGGAGNQKAINLNADVFVDSLFPAIHEEAARRGDRFPVDLDIFGPGGSGALNLQRKIVKGETYKNWRLNGEFVRDDEERFSVLQEGDFAVIEFEGDKAPYAARMVLVARGAEDDSVVHAELNSWLGDRRMARITPAQLDAIAFSARIIDAHPLNGINLQNDLEDASQGGLEATRRLFRRTATRRVSKIELKAARNQADETGALGEEFVNEWLAEEVRSGRLCGFEWVSRENAVAPYDFTISSAKGVLERLDVKATNGPFRNHLHVSMNELLHCSDSSIPYRIYRVFAIDGRRAKMRVSEPLATFAECIIGVLKGLPAGVDADGISLDPRTLEFGSDIEIELRAGNEED
ncbi:MAG: DUF3883 domain-containing protein [Xanthomonadales bacterium]|nr:DUF3883 domain-containing protein [Xanthomonadales bacterium]